MNSPEYKPRAATETLDEAHARYPQLAQHQEDWKRVRRLRKRIGLTLLIGGVVLLALLFLT